MIGWLFENAWLINGSVAGSMVAMLLARNLSLAGRIQALAIGTLVGCWVGPFICEMWFSRYDPQESRIPSFICFATGSIGMAAMPVLIRRAKEYAGRFQVRFVESKADD